MTKSERRYFKLFVQSMGTKANNYTKLFDAIAHQKAYDEEKLKRKFKGEKFINNIGVYKQYLQDVIFKALRNYHGSENISDNILDGIRNIRILHQKGLFALQKKECIRIQKLAEGFDKAYLLPIIGYWHSLTDTIMHNPNTKTMNDYELQLNKLIEDVDYLKLCISRNNEHLKSLFSFRELEIPYNIESDTPIQSNRFRYNIIHYTSQSILANLKTDWASAYKGWDKVIEYLEEHRFLLKDNDTWNSYVIFIVNALTLCTHSSHIKVNEYFMQLEKYNNLDKNKIDVSTQIAVFLSQLRFHRNTGYPKIAIDIFEKSKAFIETNMGGRLESYGLLSMLFYEGGCAYFLEKNYDKTLELFKQTTLLLKDKKQHQLFFFNMDFIKLLIYYEQEEWLLLSSFIESLRKKLKKETPFYPLGSLLLSLFRKLNRVHINREGQISALQLSHKKIINCQTSFMIDFPYTEWIESKIIGVDLKNFLKNKHDSNQTLTN